jgi:rare lipoprotein A
MWRMAALAAAAVALAGCAHKQRTALPVVPVKIGHTETGIASWYGKPYDGRASASGEIYDMETLVAAHKTMPFQTWVRVYNLTNQKSVDVRIIDRGPFVKKRIIDLSHAAAMAIDMVGPGTAKVRLVVIRAQDAVVSTAPQPPVSATPAVKPAVPKSPAPVPAAPIPVAPPPLISPPVIPPPTPPAAPPTTTTPIYSVQIGIFHDRDSAERLRKHIGQDFGVVQIVERANDPGTWRVYIGVESTEDAANALADRIRTQSDEKNAFVVRLDIQ